MTQEQKEKLEKELAPLLTAYINQKHTQGECIGYSDGFTACVQTILENPGDWGLEATKEALTGRNRVTSLQLQNAKLKTENERYRKALEKIADPIADMESELKEGESLNGAYAIKIASDGRYLSEIAKEALKQQ